MARQLIIFPCLLTGVLSTNSTELECARGLMTCPVDEYFSDVSYYVSGSHGKSECWSLGSNETRSAAIINVSACSVTHGQNETHQTNIIVLKPELPAFIFGRPPNDVVCACQFPTRLSLSSAVEHGIEQEEVTQNNASVDGATMTVETLVGNASTGLEPRFLIQVTGQLNVVRLHHCQASTGNHSLPLLTDFAAEGAVAEVLTVTVSETDFASTVSLKSFYARDSPEITIACDILQCRSRPCPSSQRRLRGSGDESVELSVKLLGDPNGKSIDSILDDAGLSTSAMGGESETVRPRSSTTIGTVGTAVGSTSAAPTRAVSSLPMLMSICSAGGVLFLALLRWRLSRRAVTAASRVQIQTNATDPTIVKGGEDDCRDQGSTASGSTSSNLSIGVPVSGLTQDLDDCVLASGSTPSSNLALGLPTSILNSTPPSPSSQLAPSPPHDPFARFFSQI